jgi:N-6 DNA Methylase
MSGARPSASFSFSAMSVEGNLLSPAILKEIANSSAPNQTESDYHVPHGVTLRDELARYFRIGQATFRHLHASSAPSLDATTRFASDLLVNVLGFSTIYSAGVLTHDSHQFPIALQALGGRVPIVVVPPAEGLEAPSAYLRPDGRRRSAAIALQDWLNVNDGVLWGLCTNGNAIRLLRDNRSLTRPAFIEFDLQQIFESEDFASFTMLWLLLHSTRFGQTDTLVSDCPLERWREAGAKTGEVALRHLAANVHEALLALGNGFLEHPANNDLRQRLASGALALSSATGEGHSFFSQLLRLVYRLIFLLAAEDRDLLHPPDTEPQLRGLYALGYSAGSLRDRAVRRAAWDNFDDRWRGLRLTFRALAHGEPRLGLPALGGLFSQNQTPDLDTLALSNRSLFRTIYSLAWLRTAAGPVPVNWRDMQTEELGSVYEGLLELTPRLADSGRAMTFAEGIETKGNERKTSGSYYTPDALVQTLLDSALDPVLDRLEAESGGTSGDAAAGLLTLTVIDPACGSGHFLLAAARRVATRVARLRADGVPTQDDYRRGLRDVVRLCIYGVDRNPMAVELSRVALWIETVEPSKPLGFLDANLRCGDSLLGVFSPDALRHGIPEAAYKPLAGDDKTIAKVFAARNKEDLKGQARLDFSGRPTSLPAPPVLAASALALRSLPENTEGDIEVRTRAFVAMRSNPELTKWFDAANLYIAAFLAPKVRPVAGSTQNQEFPGQPLVPVSSHVWRKLQGGQVYGPLLGAAEMLTAAARVFHWPLEFPHIFFAESKSRRGFDVVLGNPPWERIKLQEQEFFSAREPTIAEAPNASVRGRLITALKSAPEGSRERQLHEEYEIAKRTAEAASIFARVPESEHGRFPLSGRGDVNTYALFAELFSKLVSEGGRAGVIVPTGIATDATTAPFFASLVEGHRLARFIDFENSKGIFPNVHRSFRFSLLTIAHSIDAAAFTFFLTDTSQLGDPIRNFHLSGAQIANINPNTKTAPIFRSLRDAELTSQIYSRVPVLVKENSAQSPGGWKIEFHSRIWHMSEDSSWFVTAAEMGRNRQTGISPGTEYAPLYEAKQIHHFDHRWSTYEGVESREVTLSEKANPGFEISPRYWVPQTEVLKRLSDKGWQHQWLMGWRDITNATNERTVIASAFPLTAVGNKIPLMFPRATSQACAALIANLASLVLDYVARQKIGGTTLNFFYFFQLPVLPPEHYSQSDLDFIVYRVLELTYTSYSMTPFARDLGCEAEPFPWDENRRAMLRAELDAWFARAYGLSRDNLRYILDPADLLGEMYPSQTFRVLKEKETDKYNEYRTQRLVLAAWDRQAAGEIPASELERSPQVIPALPIYTVEYANLDDGAWVNRAVFPDRDADAYGALAAIVHALKEPTPQGIVRLAYRFALVPKKLTPLLDETKRGLWLRLVGSEARPNPDDVAEMVATVDTPFGLALSTLRSQGAIAENGAAGFWALGTAVSGLDFNAPLESRARFALDAVRSIGIDRLMGSMQPEEVAWLERRLA